jgi:class 3 adenylate cyclase
LVFYIGDIVFDDCDVYGDGVNIASQTESLAPAGGILISKNVYDEIINNDDLGKKFLSYPIPKEIVEEWEKVVNG